MTSKLTNTIKAPLGFGLGPRRTPSRFTRETPTSTTLLTTTSPSRPLRRTKASRHTQPAIAAVASPTDQFLPPQDPEATMRSMASSCTRPAFGMLDREASVPSASDLSGVTSELVRRMMSLAQQHEAQQRPAAPSTVSTSTRSVLRAPSPRVGQSERSGSGFSELSGVTSELNRRFAEMAQQELEAQQRPAASSDPTPIRSALRASSACVGQSRGSGSGSGFGETALANHILQTRSHGSTAATERWVLGAPVETVTQSSESESQSHVEPVMEKMVEVEVSEADTEARRQWNVQQHQQEMEREQERRALFERRRAERAAERQRREDNAAMWRNHRAAEYDAMRAERESEYYETKDRIRRMCNAAMEDAESKIAAAQAVGLQRSRPRAFSKAKRISSAELSRKIEAAAAQAEKEAQKPAMPVFTATHGPFGILPEVLAARCGEHELAASMAAKRPSKPTPFWRARPRRTFSRPSSTYDDAPVYRSEPAPLVVEEADDVDDATIIDHTEWERRFAQAETRRQERQQHQNEPEPEPATEHSTGILAKVKSWAGNAWAWIKRRVWG